MINVIWVDDLILNPDGTQTDMCKSIVNSAYDEGIDITPFANYDDAYIEMEKYPSKWIAIILDVRNDRAVGGSENQDYLNMRRRVEAFRKAHGNAVEPYIFVFSADPITIADAKRYFIKDAEIIKKEVYIKPNDIDALFNDIKAAAKLSTTHSIYTKYKAIIDFITTAGWSRENINNVIKLIRCVEYNDDSTNDSYYNDMRKIVETDLYKRVTEVELMKGYCDYIKKEKKNDSINTKSVFVGDRMRGKTDEDPGNKFPIYIQRAFHSLTEISQNGSHPLIVSKHTKQGKAPYLLKSCLYDLLTIINWESQL